jgi:polyhydroxybutyrate depolymerase
VGKETKETLTVGGVQREAVVYVPAKLSAAKAPGIVFLTPPGFPAVGLRARYGIGLDAEADRLGFVAVWPEGSPAAGQPGGALCCFWNHGKIDWGTQQPPDDIAFFKALLDVMTAKYPVDADRISFIGYAASSGAMSYRVACELGDRIAAFADVSSGHRDNTDCATARPVSMLLMHGTETPNAPYGGGISASSGLPVPAVTDIIDYWRKLDGCAADAAVTMLTQVTEQKRYGPCKGNTEVALITVKGGTGGWWASVTAPATGDPNLKTTPIVAEFLIKQTKTGR